MQESLVLIMLGVVFVAVSIWQTGMLKRFRESGVEAEGVVFETEQSDGYDGQGSSVTPIVRFVTTEKKWITAKPRFFISTPFIRQGQKMKVLYLPEAPGVFILDSKWVKPFLYGFMVVGVVLAGAGVVRLLGL